MFCILSGPEHLFEYVNHAHIVALGFDATGMKVREAQPESVEVHGILDNVYNTGVTALLHEIPVTLGRELRYFDLTYAPKRDSQGAVNGIMVLGNEVTNKVLIDQKLELERKRLFNFLEQVPAAIAILSGPEFVFELANSTYANLFSNKKNLVGSPLYEAIPDLSPDILNILQNVVNTGKQFTGHEYPIEIDWKNSGQPEQRYMNFFYEPFHNIKGQIEGVIAFVYDITEQVRDKDKVSMALKIRDEFLSIASHELKTPLTSLNLQIQSSQRRIAKGNSEEFSLEKLDTLFGKYKKQTDRLIRLVDDMLDLSKINLGKLSFEFQQHDLRSIIDESFENIRQQFEDKSSPLVVKDAIIPVVGNFDRERIEQVITNLLTNALKYGEGKKVEIDLVTKNKKAHIRVKDQGPGIDSENLEKIFEKFERVPASLEISGLGIGLYISREIVLAHSGKIWVESNIGQGATFVVELPVE